MLRVAVVVTACAMVAACGERFLSVPDEGGEGGQDSGGAGGTDAGGGEPDGGATDSGGKGGTSAGGQGGGAPEAGSGGASAGGSGGTGGGGTGGGGTSGGGGIGGIGGIGGLGGVGGMPAKLPISDDHLELWLRADSGVNVEDGFVNSWEDASPHQRHATQIAANYRPKLDRSGLDGKPALVFDGGDDFLDLPDMEQDFSAGVSLFMVLRPENQNECQTYLELSNGSEMDDLHLGDWQGRLLYEVEVPFINDEMYPLEFGQPIVTTARQEPNGLAQLRLNGDGAGQHSNMALPVAATRTRNYLGLSLYANCVPLKGAISEVVLFSRAVSDEEILKMEAHLRDKWACCSSD